jgi:hypothetical protein
MERVEYDPEIDPSIREEREKAERERELAARIRVEIDRYVADNNLIPRPQTPEPAAEARQTSATDNTGATGDSFDTPPWEVGSRWEHSSHDAVRPPWESTRETNGPDGQSGGSGANRGYEPDDEPESPREQRKRERRERNEAKQAEREADREAAAERAATRRKAVKSLFTGNILQTEWVRKMWPHLLGIAAVLVFYIGYNFHVAGLHLDRQRLSREVRELGIEAVERTAERVRQTRRSAIVERLKQKNIPLEEFPHPVKRIEN